MAQWVELSGAPVAVQNAGTCGLDGKLYVTGGSLNGAPSAAVQVYDIAAGRWSRVADLPVAVSDHTAIAAGRYLYVCGGSTAGGPVATVYRYSVDEDRWTYLSNLSTRGRLRIGAAAVGEMLYFFGGASDSGYDDFDYLPEREVFALNTSTGNLTNLRYILPTGRYDMGCVAVDGKIHLIGGVEYNGEWSAGTGRHELFDPGTLSLQTLASMPATHLTFAAAYGGELYATASRNTMIYSPDKDSWRFGTGLPTGSGLGGSLDAWDNRLYVVPVAAERPLLSLDLLVAEIVGAQPAAGFVDERVDNLFSWQISGSGSTVQRSAVFQWRQSGAGAVNEIPVSGAATWVSVPAGTFPNAEIQWRVMAVTTEGVETDWTEWFALTCVDQPHGAPTNLYPNNGRRSASADIQLSWVVNSPLGSAQRAFEVQVAYDDALSWKTLSGIVYSEEASYIVPGDTLVPEESGKVFWRVSTYNTDLTGGEWSEAAGFLAVVAPPAPRWVSVESGRARPLARWLASGQAGYRLRVLRGEQAVYDSGWLAGVRNEHRPGDYLHDGSYTFEVRVRNELGLESPWASTAAEIQTETWYGIELRAEADGGGVRLEFDVRAR